MLHNLAYKLGKHILYSFLSERLVMSLIVGILEKLVKSTKNGLDDKILGIFKQELKKQGLEIGN